jgi:hypothetical protein
MFRKLNRLGATACKVQITIELKELKINADRDDISLFFFDFERGSKSVSSSSRLCKTLTAKFEESLTLVMTLYKDSSGKYAEKRGKLVLKGHSKVTLSVVKLGFINLSLHNLAADFSTQKMTLTLEDSKGIRMGSISMSTTAKYLGTATAGDDDGSSVASSSASHITSSTGLGSQSYLSGIFKNETTTKEKPKTSVKSSDTRSTPRSPYSSGKANYEVIGKANYEVTGKSSTASAIRSLNSLTLSTDSPSSNSISNPHGDNFKVPANYEVAGKSSTTSATLASSNPFDEPPPNHSSIDELNSTKGAEDRDKKENLSKFNTKKKKKDFSEDESNRQFDDKDRKINSLILELEVTKNCQNALEEDFQTKITTMIERIMELEDEGDLEQIKHEQQIIKLLKAAGVYDKSGYDPHNPQNNDKQSELWPDLFRQQLDEERFKIMALKTCLMRFTDHLTRDDNHRLLDAGIILVASDASDS